MISSKQFFYLDNAKKLQFDTFVRLVKEFGPDNEARAVEFSYERLGPSSESKIHTRPMIKKYKTVNQKGIIDKNFNVWPFGYS